MDIIPRRKIPLNIRPKEINEEHCGRKKIGIMRNAMNISTSIIRSKMSVPKDTARGNLFFFQRMKARANSPIRAGMILFIMNPIKTLLNRCFLEVPGMSGSINFQRIERKKSVRIIRKQTRIREVTLTALSSENRLSISTSFKKI